MVYKVINEELKIASCRIADLTMEQVSAFLKIWNDDSKIGSLTVFYDKNSEYLVLNEDNKEFQLYLDVAEGYLRADNERKKEIRKAAPPSMRETIRVLDGFRERQLIETWIKRASTGHISDFERKMIRSIQGPCSEFIAFRLGMIRGKRIERAKKKKAGVINANA